MAVRGPRPSVRRGASDTTIARSRVPTHDPLRDAVRDDPPDLVLTDVMMPRLDGFGLLRALREDPRTRRLPVLLLSALPGVSCFARCR